LERQVDRFNNYIATNKIKKYVFVFGVISGVGYDSIDFNIFKSNLWTFLLAWKYLKIKPYDIILNFNMAVRLHYPNIKDYLIVDDCSYSGMQLVDSVLKNVASELLFHSKDGYQIVDDWQTMYEPIQQKICNIHLLIPYVSTIALAKINNFQTLSGMNIITYISKIIRPYGEIFNFIVLNKIREMYNKFIQYPDFSRLVPIYFQHKIADSVSTIDMILIKGQVIDDPTKRMVFIKECQYDKNDVNKTYLNPDVPDFNKIKVYCPVPPYLNFYKYLYN